MSLIKLCSIDNCKGIVKARGWCNKHWYRWYKHGDPLTTKTLKEYERHGHQYKKKTKVYTAWDSIIQRCTNKNDIEYQHYGGRGIHICEEWRHSFMAFYNYLGEPPNGKYTIDRIDNDKGYQPGNVRWATQTTQNFNQRIRSDNTSGYRGVSWSKVMHRWAVEITVNGRRHKLGYYNTPQEANRVYIEAKRKLLEDYYADAAE